MYIFICWVKDPIFWYLFCPYDELKDIFWYCKLCKLFFKKWIFTTKYFYIYCVIYRFEIVNNWIIYCCVIYRFSWFVKNSSLLMFSFDFTFCIPLLTHNRHMFITNNLSRPFFCSFQHPQPNAVPTIRTYNDDATHHVNKTFNALVQLEVK